MAEASLPYASDLAGNYTFHTPIQVSQILDLAASILRERFSRDTPISNPKDAARFLQLELGRLERKEFAVLFLDDRHRMIGFERMFRGTVDGATVHPREVVKRALAVNAAAVIFAHNHPSGVSEPSRADENLAKRLKDAMALVEVRVLDHLIVAGMETVSLAERGLI